MIAPHSAVPSLNWPCFLITFTCDQVHFHFDIFHLSEPSCPNQSAIAGDNVKAEISPAEEATTMIRPPQLKSKRKAMQENCILKIVARCWKSCGLAHCEKTREDYTV